MAIPFMQDEGVLWPHRTLVKMKSRRAIINQLEVLITAGQYKIVIKLKTIQLSRRQWHDKGTSKGSTGPWPLPLMRGQK
jgi:hypothetical protein